MPHVTIRDIRKVIATGGARIGQVDTMVTFQEESGDIRMLTIEKPEPSDAEIQGAIKKEIASRAALIGKTIQV